MPTVDSGVSVSSAGLLNAVVFCRIWSRKIGITLPLFWDSVKADSCGGVSRYQFKWDGIRGMLNQILRF